VNSLILLIVCILEENNLGIIAPHGCCAGYEANYDKLRDTRPDAEDR
jgi:hypothetical protein